MNKLTPVIAVDFDGTLCESAWPDIGAERPGLIDFLKAWQAQGNKVILWTNRTGERLDAAVDWCAERGLAFDAVNENLRERIDFFGGDCRKISADYYIDDKNATVAGIGPEALTLENGVTMSAAKTTMTGGSGMRERYLFRIDMKVLDEEAEVMLYSEIQNEKLFGDECTPEDFDKALKDAKAKGAQKLNLRINSPGGDVFSAVAMRTMIMNAGFKSVRVMIEGLCASAATLIATVPGARVIISDGSMFMIHNPVTFAFGNADEIEKSVEVLRNMEGTFRDMYAAKSGQDDETIKSWMDAETWFTAKRAVEEGFCDELLEAAPVAASVTARDMAAMCALYHNVPKDIQIRPETPEEAAAEPESPIAAGTGEQENVSNDDPGAGLSPEITGKEEARMEIKDCTREELLAENPALVQEIAALAVADERARVSEIDALTIPGFEAEAQEAKETGVSAVDFVKSIAAKAKAKGAAFMAERAKETAPAAEVAAAAAEDDVPDEKTEMKAKAQKIADKAAEILKTGNI